MSKSLFGQKSLGLTTCLMITTGLVLSFTQSLDEDRSAVVSKADLREQGLAGTLFAQADASVPNAALSASAPSPIRAAAAHPNSSGQYKKGTYVQLAEPSEQDLRFQTREPYEIAKYSDLEETLVVNPSGKGDRRRRWTWEPYKVSHGRRTIAMNWSGSVWHMASPMAQEDNSELPKLVFSPNEDLRLVMADAQQFLKVEDIAPDSDMMFAQNEVDGKGPARIEPVVNGSTALAYAPTSDGMDAPFEAILTEQRTGQISEDNQVTVLDAIDDYNQTGDDKEAVKSAPALASIAPIDALPRVRVPFTGAASSTEKTAKVSQPLDISPIVANAKETQTEPELDNNGDKNIPLTMALSQERRAELQLAKLEDDQPEVKNKKKSRWASWFDFSSKKAKIDAKGEHAWVTNKLPKSSYSKKQKTCLANAIYFESRSEPEDGQIAVGQVVLNRVKNPAYPDSICGVVYQNQNMRNACQFSFACDGIPDRVRSKKAWDLAWKLANEVVNEEVWLKSVGSSTHYHATYVHPKWARTMKKRKKIGLHIFYNTYGGGWS